MSLKTEAFELKNSIHDYHKDREYVSKTGLSMVLDRPSTFYKYYLAEGDAKENFKKSPSLMIGDAVHVATLEPHLFDGAYMVSSFKNRSLKGFKDLAIDNPDKTILTIGEHDKIKRMSDALISNPCARAYLEMKGQAEKSFYWERNGLKVKCRPDYLTDDSMFCIDLKTTKNIGKKSFLRDSDSYKYYLSASMTLAGVEAVRNKRPEAYIILGVENTGDKKPDTAVYYYDDDAIEFGEIQLDEGLERIKKYRDLNHWPAISDKAEPLGLGYENRRNLEFLREKKASEILENFAEREFNYAG